MTKVSKTSSIHMGSGGVFREAIKIPLRNGMLMLSIALLISSSLVYLAGYFALIPVTKDLVLKYFLLHRKDTASSEYTELLAGIQEDIQILVGEETIFILAFYVLTLLFTLAMIYASAVSYSGKHLKHKELISTIRRTWKRLVITWLYVSLFRLGYATLLISLIVVLVGTAKGSIIFIAFGVLVGLFLILLLVYLAVILKLGLVVSVLEESCSGLRALGRANELVKGRKLQGFVLSFIITLVYLVITGIFTFKMMDVKLAIVTRLGIGVAFISTNCIEQLFMFVVFTVFYLECKESHGEEVEIQGKYGYNLVSTNPNVCLLELNWCFLCKMFVLIIKIAVARVIWHVQ